MYVIADRWYVVLASAELRAGAPLAVVRMGHAMVFWRGMDGEVLAVLDGCPHRGAKLSLGRVKDGCIACPFHGLQFDGTGRCVKVPAHPDRPISGALRATALQVRESEGFIWLFTGPSAPPAGPPPFFDFDGYWSEGSQFSIDVGVHYTRAIENQLDFAHLPFTHPNTLGRILGREAMTIEATVDHDTIRCRLSDSNAGAVEFLGPNLWRNRAGPMFQFLAFVPIDDRRMRYYIRTYQPWVRLPVLAWLVGRLNRFLNGFVMAEDASVVTAQPNVETRLRMGEVLVQCDAGIIAYRRWREARRVPFGARPPRAAQTAVDHEEGSDA